MKTKKTKETIEKELEGLENFVVAIISSIESYYSANIGILDYLVNTRKMNGIYITMNKPYFSIVKTLKKNNIDPSKLFFIDAISGSINYECKADNCMILSGPTALGELGISVLKLCETKKANFLLLDSLSTMVVYNDTTESVTLSHNIINHLRKYGLNGVIIFLEKDMEDRRLNPVIQFCDKYIKIK